MKKVFFGNVVIVMAALMAGGCGSIQSGMQISTAKEAQKVNVNFNSEPTGILTVTNNVNDSLILFAGSIANGSIIGGIHNGPSAKRTFDVFDDVPEPSGSFLLRAVREAAYRQYGSAVPEDEVIYSRLITYDKTKRDEKTNITIDSRVGGDAIIYFENDSSMVLEIRLDSPVGDKIATLPPFQRKKAIHLNADPYGYTYFPTYVYYDNGQKQLQSITTNDLAAGRSMRPIIPGSGEDVPFVVFPKPNTPDITAPVATVLVRNASNNGAFFREGTAPKTSGRGNVMINSGGTETYELDMHRQKEAKIPGLNIDTRRGESNVILVNKDLLFKAGYVYTIVLLPDFTLEYQVSEPTSYDADSLDITLINEYR
ncbi:MAG: hypothetical protein LBD58_03345 [Treponema sp.]|jgi:hypothetical protein|nr:hypothetical protein [Treponema sp.]